MRSANAVILNNPYLEKEILFRQIKSYIEISLKNSNIKNIFYADSLENINEEMLDAENIIIIKDIVPEIMEYDSLVSSHIEQGADISFFATYAHSDENGIIFDDSNTAIAFGHSHEQAKMDIFVVKTENFKENIGNLLEDTFNYKTNFIYVAESTVIENLTDIVMLADEFKNTVNYNHIENGVYILDPNTTYISPDVLIESGVTILPNTIIRGVSSIGEGATIGPNTLIDTSSIGAFTKINSSQCFESVIGEHTTVGPFAYIRPLSNIGDHVKIGDFVEIKKAKLGNGTKVSHLTYIGDATVGENVNFGCGTVVVNYDGFTKNQTIVEDNAFIGCNTNLVSPVKVGKGAYTAAGSTITQDVPSNDLAIARAKQQNKTGWAEKFRALKNKNK